jgi:hypothetical protein
MSVNNSSICQFGTEISATLTGTNALIGTLPVNPVILIFDNQSAAPAAIYVNGTAPANLWRTFPAGEALVLDLRDKSHLASNFTPPIGTAFYGTGTGTFSISYVNALSV